MGGTQSYDALPPVQQEDNGAGVGLLPRQDRRIATWDPEEGGRRPRSLAHEASDDESDSSDNEAMSRSPSKDSKKSADEPPTTEREWIDPVKYALSIQLALIIMVCGFPCADVITDYTQALPALYKEDKASFYMQLMVLVCAGAVGAIAYAQEHKTIPEYFSMPQQPGFKAAYFIKLVLVFPFFPYEVVVTAAWAWSTGNQELLKQCVVDAQLAAASELMEAVLSFGLQSHAYFNLGVYEVLPSLLCGLGCLVKCALEQNTSKKVYWSFKMQGEAEQQTTDKKFPILTGPVEGYSGLLSSKLRFVLLGLHYVFEIVSGVGCVVLFHHILHDPFVVPRLHGSLAWMIFMALQAVLMLLALLRTSSLSVLQALQAACTGQFFINLPILDAHVPVIYTYAARFVGQAIVFILVCTVSMPTKPQRIAMLTRITVVASSGMIVTFITVRRCFAVKTPTRRQRLFIKDAKRDIIEDISEKRRSLTWCNLTRAEAEHPTIRKFIQKCFQEARERKMARIDSDGHQSSENQLKDKNEFIAFSMSLVYLEEGAQQFPVHIVGGALDALTGLVECPTYLEAATSYFNGMTIEDEMQRKNLPPEIGQLHSLKVLKISRCSFTWLPSELTQLCKLEKLEVSECGELTFLAPELGECEALNWLSVSRCEKLKSLPLKLRHLTKLEVSDCAALSSLPEDLGQLEDLKELKVSKCGRLKSLEAESGGLVALESLEVSECRELEDLPALAMTMKEDGNIDDAQLKSLKELKVSYCPKLMALPEQFGHLAALGKLEVSECERLESLPSDLTKLTNMKVLKVSNCGKLNRLPPSLKGLDALEELEIIGCTGLSSLPEGLHELPGLKRVEVSQCWKLTALPKLGESLESLTILDCRELNSLPNLEHLEKLAKLNIVYCAKLNADSNEMLKKLRHNLENRRARLEGQF